MTNFPWENQGIRHGREDVRQILRKIENFANLPSGEEGWRKAAHRLCHQVERSQEDARDFWPITTPYGTLCAERSHPTCRLILTDEESVATNISFSPRGKYNCRNALPRLRDDERALNDIQSVVPLKHLIVFMNSMWLQIRTPGSSICSESSHWLFMTGGFRSFLFLVCLHPINNGASPVMFLVAVPVSACWLRSIVYWGWQWTEVFISFEVVMPHTNLAKLPGWHLSKLIP